MVKHSKTAMRFDMTDEGGIKPITQYTPCSKRLVLDWHEAVWVCVMVSVGLPGCLWKQKQNKNLTFCCCCLLSWGGGGCSLCFNFADTFQ